MLFCPCDAQFFFAFLTVRFVIYLFTYLAIVWSSVKSINDILSNPASCTYLSFHTISYGLLPAGSL